MEQRRSKFMIVLASAAITFATLFAIIGKPAYAKHSPSFGHCQKAEEQVPVEK